MSQIDYDCPTCGKSYRFSMKNVGLKARCRECQCTFKIEPEVHLRAEPYVSPVHRSPQVEKVYYSFENKPARTQKPMTRRELERASYNSSPSANALCAIINLLFSPFGYLVQGRVKEFAVTFLLGLALGITGLILVFPLLGLPVLWLFSVYDCATYKGE